MDASIHTMQTLFCQLGMAQALRNRSLLLLKSTDRFTPNIALSGADFWNESQAAFLAEAIAEDSDWCELVDELDCLLREN